jgi:hypothetical protein
MSGSHLNLHPALGFGTPMRFEAAAAQRDADLRHAGVDPSKGRHRLWGKQIMLLDDVAKIAGYFCGTITGVARLALNLYAYANTRIPEKQALCVNHMWRGAGEIFLGPLMVIPDIIQTVYDHMIVQDYQNTRAQPKTTR